MFEREVYVRVLTPIAKQRIKENKCPSCKSPYWNKKRIRKLKEVRKKNEKNLDR